MNNGTSAREIANLQEPTKEWTGTEADTLA